MQRIVVHDRSGDWPAGTVLEGPKQLGLLELEKGTVLLPVDNDLLGRNAIGGFFSRAWGPGWRYPAHVASRGCPMLLYVVPDRPFLHWVARLVRLGDDVQGYLRLTTNTGQIGAMSGGLTATNAPVDLAALGAPDDEDSWTIRGTSRLVVSTEGYLGLSLYGLAKDVAVAWAAVSQSKQPE